MFSVWNYLPSFHPLDLNPTITSLGKFSLGIPPLPSKPGQVFLLYSFMKLCIFIAFVVCHYLLTVCLSNWIVTSLESSIVTLLAHHCFWRPQDSNCHMIPDEYDEWMTVTLQCNVCACLLYWILILLRESIMLFNGFLLLCITWFLACNRCSNNNM